jgi:hypothetical protein
MPPAGLLLDQVKEDEMGTACNTNWGEGKVYKILVINPEGKETTKKTKTSVGGQY